MRWSAAPHPAELAVEHVLQVGDLDADEFEFEFGLIPAALGREGLTSDLASASDATATVRPVAGLAVQRVIVASISTIWSV